jgi:hypothetical protein
MGRRRKIPTVQPDPIQTIHGAYPKATLDLHGLVAAQAERRILTFVQGWAEREPGVVLRIITGKGTNSEGSPVLRGRLLELLGGPLKGWVAEWATEVGGGSYLVRVQVGRSPR